MHRSTLRLWLPLGALVLAAVGCQESGPPRVAAAYMARDAGGMLRTNRYEPKDTFHCILKLAGAREPMPVKVVWSRRTGQDAPWLPLHTAEGEFPTGRIDIQRANRKVVPIDADSPEKGHKLQPVPWPVGEYQADVYFDGQRFDTLPFSVVPPDAPPHE